MEVGVVISIAAVLISFIGLMMNSRKDTRTDAAQNATTQTKLNTLLSGVDDIRVEMKSIQKSLGEHSERLTKLEVKMESDSHRIEVLEGKV